MPATRRRPRGRTSRPELSREHIAAAALDFLDRHSLDELSMRRLADELGVGTMTLYGYFRDKDELLDAIADHHTGQLEVPDVSGPWREAIRDLAVALHRSLTTRPAIVRLRLARPTLSAQALRYTEVAMRVFRDAGFSDADAAYGYRALFNYTFGFAAVSPPAESEDHRRRSRAALAMLPEDEFPTIVSMGPHLVDAMAGDEVFEFGLDRLLDGLESRLAKARKRRT